LVFLFLINTIDNSITVARSGRITEVGNSGRIDAGDPNARTTVWLL
jgi:hypothetical protein